MDIESQWVNDAFSFTSESSTNRRRLRNKKKAQGGVTALLVSRKSLQLPFDSAQVGYGYLQGDNTYYTNNITVSMWLKAINTGNPHPFGTALDLGYFTNNNVGLVVGKTGNNGYRIGRTTVYGISVNMQTNWTHITFGIENGFLRYVYVNGALRTANANLNMGTRTNTIMRIGCLVDNLQYPDNFKGLLDDVVIWNTYLPQATAATFNTVTNFTSHSPSAWYRFEDNGLDQSGNGRHLTAVNTVFYTTDVR